MAGLGVGTGALSSLLGKFTTLLSEEYKLLESVRKEVEFLQRELGSMQGLLETLADKPKLDPQEKLLKGNVRELTYAIEDCIDRFMLRFGRGDAKTGFVKNIVRRLKKLRKRHEIATQIKDLKALVMEESQRRKRYKLDNHSQTSRSVEIDPRLPALYAEAKGLVAIDGPMDRVVSWLTEKSVELKVVAIVGGGGLGKTTLAMEVYRKIGGGFDCRASVSVSCTLDLDKLLKDILSQIDQDAFRKCQEERWEREQLIRETRRILTGKRYFIVIDDVWKEEDWKFVKAAFPDNDNGSRIIATTRITSVANSCCSNSGDQLYKMAALNDVDSRMLFFKRIFHPDNSCPPQLEKVSTKILKKCGGLPLAIITIASLLANKPQNVHEWERLQDSIGTGLSYENDDDGKGMRDILLLSYWGLPHHLKTCLLYLCIYPEDHRIKCEELKCKWIAEGFVATQWGNLCQEAENYFNALVNRNMIQPVDVGYDGVIHYCQVHDMMRDLIISLSEEENFAIILNGRVCNSLPRKIRRLSMQPCGQEHKGAIHEITTSKLHIRSLNVFGETEQIPPLVDFHSLRVLDLFCDYKHINNIGSLSQLRYLRLNSTTIELPEEIGELQYLETLDLWGCYDLRKLPSTIVRLQKLVRLFVHHCVMLPEDVLGSMQALEEVSEIYNIDNPVKFAEELGHLTKLRKLSITYDKPRGGNVLEFLGSSLNKLVKYNLRYLCTTAQIGDYLFRDPSCTCLHLEVLKMRGFMKRVPKGMAYLNDIVNLDMKVVRLDEQGLHLLMGLPSLTHLQLEIKANWKIKPITVGSNGFRLLKVFLFTVKGHTGTGIAFAPGAMTALQRFHLRWRAREVMSNSYSDSADMGIEHLSGLAHLQVETDCHYATVGEVETMEGSLEKAIALHPNRHSLQVHLRRISENHIFKDDERDKALEWLIDQYLDSF